MNSIWLSLLWKEWCEQRWKLAALVGVLIAVPTVILLMIYLSGSAPRSYLKGMILLPISILMPFVVLAGTFVGMSVAGGENSRRTMRFLQALPAPTWQVALVKLLAAFFTVAIPILIVMGAVWAFAGVIDPEGQLSSNIVRVVPPMSHPAGISNWYAGRMVANILAVCSLVLWTAACGVNRSDEIRAGALGFLIIAAAWGLWMYAMYLAERYEFTSVWSVVNVLRAALPGGLATTGFGTARPGLEMVVAVFAHLALLIWFLRRYGKIAATQQGGGGLQISDLFQYKSGKLPRQTPLGAIIWKQAREIGPLALFAMVGVVSLALLVHKWGDGQSSMNVFGEVLIALTVSVGILVTLVSGVGIMLEDYQPKVNTFWRSRPINPHLWFAAKYLTGIGILALAFAPVSVAVNWASGWRYASPQETLGVILFFTAVYTLSLTAYALVRQPIYAVVLAMGSLWPLGFLSGFAYGLTERLGPDLASFVAWTFLVIAYVAVVLLAWQAVVRDWGWKQHR